MDEIDKLVLSIKQEVDSARQQQIRFVTCKSVDWKSKTMVASGNGDNIEYLDVALGFGYIDIRPKVGTTCLIGIADGQDTYTFLINAEEVDTVEVNADKMIYNGGLNAGIVKVKELTSKINALEIDLNALKQLLMAWVPVPQDGGASLKSTIAMWLGSRITETLQSEIEDDKITH